MSLWSARRGKQGHRYCNKDSIFIKYKEHDALVLSYAYSFKWHNMLKFCWHLVFLYIHLWILRSVLISIFKARRGACGVDGACCGSPLWNALLLCSSPPAGSPPSPIWTSVRLQREAGSLGTWWLASQTHREHSHQRLFTHKYFSSTSRAVVWPTCLNKKCL